MTRIVVDAELRNKLHDLTQPLELCDEEGKVLAKLTPVIDWSEWEPITPDVSEEELDRREKSTEWYTFEHVMEHLKKLENQ